MKCRLLCDSSRAIQKPCKSGCSVTRKTCSKETDLRSWDRPVPELDDPTQSKSVYGHNETADAASVGDFLAMICFGNTEGKSLAGLFRRELANEVAAVDFNER